LRSKPFGSKLNITAAAPTRFPSLNAALGDAPKNPRFYPIQRDSAPFGPNTAEAENKAFPKTPLKSSTSNESAERQNANPQKP
jgi:hypothetical protein